jgi:probable F420-dependent oxidoreductase
VTASPTNASWGIFTSAPRLHAPGAAEALARVEALGFDALWVANVKDELSVLDLALDATEGITVGPAILSIWSVDAPDLAAWWAGRERLTLGLGVSHAPLVAQYTKPMAAMVDYLDQLDAAGVPASARALGANGPKMLALAADRSAGALTYLVTPEQTAVHREQLGPSARLVPEVKLVLDDDPERARETARTHLSVYLGLPNYVGNLRRMGFGDEDLTPPGSDRLLDALVVRGDVDAVRARVDAHLAAGADGIALHVLGEDPLPVAAWSRLAEAVIPGGTPA